MFRFIALRILRWIPSALLILVVIYALLFFGAGDPIRLMFLRAPGDVAWDTVRIEAMRQELGLDRPFLVQFGDYVWNVLHGNFGNSLVTKRSVWDILKAAAPVTVQLGLAATVVIALLGIPLGVVSALNNNSWVDNVILSSALFMWAVPTFVAAPLLMVFLVLGLKVMDVPYGWDGLFSYKAVVPLAVLSFRPMAIVIRQARSAVLEVLSEDYIRTAYAKGIPDYVVILRHVLRPVLTPVITQLGLVLAALVQGSMLLEVVFGIPGLGRLIATSTVDSDYPTVLAIVLIGSMLVMLTNLLVEITYPILDPRVRQAQAEG